MPPPHKPPPGRPPPQTDDTDPGAPIDMLKTGSMRLPPRKPMPVKPAPQAPAQGDDDEVTAAAPAPGERTLVYDQNQARPVGTRPKVVLTSGPRAGTEVELAHDETMMGRGGDNTIVIPDISVSRHHALIRKEPRGYVVLDQGSGNGTRVNGFITGRHELQSGDVIDLGDTSMQFVEAGGVLVKGGKKKSSANLAPVQQAVRAGGALAQVRGAAAPDRDSSDHTNPRGTGLQKRTPLYLALAVVLVAVLAVGLLRKRQNERAETDAAEHTSGSAVVAKKRFAEAVELVKQGKWVDARDKLTIAASLDETDDEIRRYLERARAESPRAQAVARAEAAIGHRDFKGAREQLAAVPDDSALADKAAALLNTIRLQLDFAVRDARAKADTGDAATAEALIIPVLEAEPARRDALAVRDSLQARKRAATAVRRSDGDEEPAARPVRASPEPEPATEPAAISTIIDTYLTGDVRSALTRAESAGVTDSGAARLARQLRELDQAYREGLARTESRKPGEALRALETADKLDRAIAKGRESRMGKEVRRALGKIHYSLGAASLATDDGLPRAAIHLRAAVAADPGNEIAKQQLDQVTARAKELYLRAYVAKDNDAEAARIGFKLVVDILPAGDATADKAKRWLEKLDGKGPKDEDG